MLGLQTGTPSAETAADDITVRLEQEESWSGGRGRSPSEDGHTRDRKPTGGGAGLASICSLSGILYVTVLTHTPGVGSIINLILYVGDCRAESSGKLHKVPEEV